MHFKDITIVIVYAVSVLRNEAANIWLRDAAKDTPHPSAKSLCASKIMVSKIAKSRNKEVAEIVEFDRAVEIARLFLGKLTTPLRRIFPEDYESLPRKNLKSGKHSIRGPEGKEMVEFYQQNFIGKNFKAFSSIYEVLYENNSQLRLPLTEFIEYGKWGQVCL